jgi:glutathione S-transferase
MTRPLTILGAPGSPYSRKMRSLLRYRRIPYHWIIRNSAADTERLELPVGLIPVLVFRKQDGAADPMLDSTFQIRRLEQEHPERSVVPPDPAIALVDSLLEDYADEWLTKAMFHYRWSFEPDVAKAGAVLPRWSHVDAPNEQVAPFTKMICERQIARRALVGINDTTAPVIEESYRRLLGLLDARLTDAPFLMGRRPGASDFALFGQLSQLVLFEPTSMAIAVEQAPRVYAWCEIMEDLSGIEPGDADWVDRNSVPDTLRALLAEAGRTYVPFLLANAAAVGNGSATVECEIDGRPWSQPPFKYQAKCLAWLREEYATLAPADRAALDSMLADTGCGALFA